EGPASPPVRVTPFSEVEKRFHKVRPARSNRRREDTPHALSADASAKSRPCPKAAYSLTAVTAPSPCPWCLLRERPLQRGCQRFSLPGQASRAGPERAPPWQT